MKHLLLFSFLAALLSAAAQTPEYFIPGTKWLIQNYYTDGFGDCYYHEYYAMEYSGQDTLVGSYSYKKLYKHGYRTFMNTQQCHQELNDTLSEYLFVRQSGKRIYFLDYNDTDTLVYDFNLSVGDTVPITAYVNPYTSTEECATIVSGIDSIWVDGFYRHIFHLENGYNYVEGIGSTRGFINLHESVSCPFEDNSELLCFAVSDTMYYPNYGPSNCVFNLGINEPDQMVVLVYPNPASAMIALQLPEGVLVSSAELVDLQGRRKRVSISGNSTIDVSSLAAGSYFVFVQTTDGEVAAGKFIRQD